MSYSVRTSSLLWAISKDTCRTLGQLIRLFQLFLEPTVPVVSSPNKRDALYRRQAKLAAEKRNRDGSTRIIFAVLSADVRVFDAYEIWTTDRDVSSVAVLTVVWIVFLVQFLRCDAHSRVRKHRHTVHAPKSSIRGNPCSLWVG